MLVTFSPIFIADTKIIFFYSFVASLSSRELLVIRLLKLTYFDKRFNTFKGQCFHHTRKALEL